MPDRKRQFETFNDWVVNGPVELTNHPKYDVQNFRAICFDTERRLCRSPQDFARARDESTFPIRWVWPDEVPALVLAQEARDTVNDDE